MNIGIVPLMIGLAFAMTFGLEAGAAGRGAKPKKSPKQQKAVPAQTGQLSTDVKFDDSVLHGQYQTPDEALAKVEDEKGLSDLIGVRKHFTDRIKQSAEQE
jgi:hypothetical protein